tara:strand:+ start:165 stop:473 length:309 start_codon:yes stop_codon:yes gene_type:complete
MKDKLKTKIILPDIDPEDFPYKFYKCWWHDIISCENWEDLTTIKKSKPATCITMGWLISTKNNNYVFVADVSFNDDETITQGGNATTIPKSNVLKLKEIKNI